MKVEEKDINPKTGYPNWITATPVMGSEIEVYVHIKRIIYPKVASISELKPGSWGVVVVTVDEILSGQIPNELTSVAFGDASVEFSVTGAIPPLNLSIMYYLKGKLSTSKYGLQYTVDQFHRVYEFRSPEEQKAFLNIVIGENKTALLFSHFDDPIRLLKDRDIEALSSVPGIGEVTAEILCDKYKNNFETGIGYAKLSDYGLSATMIQRLSETFKSLDTVAYILETSPYSLIGQIPGIGWQKADDIALNGGFNPNGEERLRTFTKWFLWECANDSGHSWVPLDFLVTAIKAKAPTIANADLLVMMRRWVDDEQEDSFLFVDRPTQRVGLRYIRRIEESVASHLTRLRHSATTFYSNEEIEDGIKQAEEEVGFQYTEEQRQAIYSCLQNNVTIIIGSAGCGKTSIMKPVVNIIKNRNLTFAQCSLSGKASSNLSEVTGAEGKTIHRLLGYNPKINSFFRNQDNPLDEDCIILDEVSLVGADMFLNLICAIKNGAKLVCLGDSKQLESIGMGNLIKDIPESKIIPCCQLLKIHRQAEASGIITESLRVSAGQQIISYDPVDERRGALKDLHVTSLMENSLTTPTIINSYIELWRDRKIHPRDIMVVVPNRDRGEVSCLFLNKQIQSIVNGFASSDDIVIGASPETSYILRRGDKILIRKNCYDTVDVADNAYPIFNGNTGFLIDIRLEPPQKPRVEKRINENGEEIEVVIPPPQPDLEMLVDIGGPNLVRIPRVKWNSVELGYALTCHSAQGTGVPYVIVGMDIRAYTLLSKEWLYTAMTRAKRECHLVTQISAARKAVQISRVSIKHTWLKELLAYKEEEYQKTHQVAVSTDMGGDFIEKASELEARFEAFYKKKTVADVVQTANTLGGKNDQK